jgi:hypothetical protein
MAIAYVTDRREHGASWARGANAGGVAAMSHVSEQAATRNVPWVGLVTLCAGAAGFMFWVLYSEMNQLNVQITQSEERLLSRFTSEIGSTRTGLENSIEVLAGRVDALERNPDPLGLVAIELYRQRLLQLIDGVSLGVPDEGGGNRQYPAAVEWFKQAFAQQASISLEQADQQVEAALLNPITREGSVALSLLERINRSSDDPAVKRNVQMVANELYLALPDNRPTAIPRP